MRKSEKKGPNFLGRHSSISKFTFSESSHQIRQLGQNRIFAFFVRKKLLQASFELLCLQLSENIELTTLFRDNGKGALKLEYRKL